MPKQKEIYGMFVNNLSNVRVFNKYVGVYFIKKKYPQ